MSEELSTLSSRYPLPESWLQVQLFSDQARVDGVDIELTGITSSSQQQMEAFGSAAEIGRSPITRAYFELVERVSVLEAGKMPAETQWELTDLNGSRVMNVSQRLLFPMEPAGAEWRYSKSNGVAVHTSRSTAIYSAVLELFERDWILRSWYGRFPPTEVPFPDQTLRTALGASYEMHAYVWRRGTGELGSDFPAVAVSAVFGFPKNEKAPLFFGYGAGFNSAESLQRASKESIQRLGFLWGEEIPGEPPEPTPTPSFHQEYYLCRKNIQKLKNWLQGSQRSQSCKTIQNPPARPSELGVLVADITPANLVGKAHVVKAFSRNLLPLTFGLGNPRLKGEADQELLIHPIA